MSIKTKKPRRRSERPAPPRWPLLLMALGVLVLGAMAFVAWRSGSQATSTGSGDPSLKADRREVNLGDVRLGETVEVSFELKNTGTGTLRFSEAPWVEVVEGC